MNFKIHAVFLLILGIYVTDSESAKILGVFTSNSKSHLIIHMSVVHELVKQGHDVTVVTTLPLTKPKADQNNGKTYRHIKLQDDSYRHLMKSLLEVNSFWQRIGQFFENIGVMLESADNSLKRPELKKLMNEETFDLLLMSYFVNDFHVGLGAHFKCPIVVIWTGQPFFSVNNLVRNPTEISYVPNVFLKTANSQRMSFTERFQNFLLWGMEQLITPIMEHVMKAYYEDNFPLDKYPSYEVAKRNVSLVLCNHHFSEGPIRANVPALVEIGGIQIKPKPDPLPTDIKRFLDSAKKQGAIFFSLGSNVHSTDLESDTIAKIYNVLSQLKQKVLWKWENDQRPGNSTNIFFSKWLPQDDILAHPNIRLFITHGGKGSVVEAKYHGVPMIGIPIFADQPLNVRNIENSGYGVGLDLKSFTEQTLHDAIDEIITNPKYRQNIKVFADLYRDRPMSARQTAVFWIEYVLRHRGAPHLQSPAVHMTKIEYWGLDIGLVVLLVLFVWYKISVFMMKFMWRRLVSCCCKSTSSKVTAKKTKKQ